MGAQLWRKREPAFSEDRGGMIVKHTLSRIAVAALMLHFAGACAFAGDCPFGSAVIEAREGFKDKLGFNMHEGPVEPLPVQEYQCVRYDRRSKAWLGYRGGTAYVFPAEKVRVWAADGELAADENGTVTKKPRLPFVVWSGEFLTGESVDSVTYDAGNNVWKVTRTDPDTGKRESGEYPADEYDAYDKDGRLMPTR